MNGQIQHNLLAGKKVQFYTLGCKLNFAETSTIGRELDRWGVLRIPETESTAPDIAIINTCSVTDMADKKCRSVIRKIHRSAPDCTIVVVGCYAQLKGDDIRQIPGVSIVVGAGRKLEVPTLLQEYYQQKRQGGSVWVESEKKHLHHFEHGCSSDDRTRHFLKVQDGCDYYCSYCTIPLARGRSRNGSIASIVQQARQVGEEGGREIVLTGVNIGDFGRSTGERFIDLLRALEAETSIERFRIGSIEPNLLDETIIDFVARSPRFMPHFHLPLQSGSDAVLSLMKRRYDTRLFRQRIEAIRRVMPDAFIGVDVIAGMRGEEDSLFEEGFHFLSSISFTHLHVFPYSERANTKALEITPIVSQTQKSERVHRLITLSDEHHSQFVALHKGEARPVLWERHQDDHGYMYGFSDNYIRLRSAYDPEKAGTIQTVVVGEEVDTKEHICRALLPLD